MIAFDHVILTTDDPAALAATLRERTGLAALAGGRHTGHGTGNWLVPLGDSYLELLTVVDVDEARGNSFGRWVLERPGHGLGLVCLRTDDADAVAARLDRSPVPMSRVTTDGDELRWRLVGLDDALTDGLPFFIEWDLDPGVPHPGRLAAPHDTTPHGITRIDLGGDPREVAAWLGDHDLPVRLVGGDAGPQALTLATAAGEVALDGTALP